MSLTLTLAHHLWMSWLQIASEHERAAERARTRGLELVGGGDAVAEEMHASMVAISGAAHAIDALYGEIRPLVSAPATVTATWNANRTARRVRIFETLKLGCTLGNRTNRWPPQFKALYLLRDQVAHHEIRHQPSVPHPNGLTNVSQEMADYSVENVRESLDLAFDVILTTLRNPLALALVAWAERMNHVPAAVEAYRPLSS
jgi:hypothetical protein